MSQTPAPPKWAVELNSPPVSRTKSTIPDPPGYTAASSGNKVRTHSICICTPLTCLETNRRLQNARSNRPNHRRNGHIKAKESLGDRACASQATTHDRDHDVHVRELFTDIQYNDGGYGVQESYHGISSYESGV